MNHSQKLSIKKNITVGLMLFALFLGAGNIIFPPELGQMAGEKIVISMIGFLITGVGLPLLAVIAIAKSGSDFELIASRVHPLFGAIFTMIVYLSIGPFFGIPRTATVSYEIGIVPFLPETLQNTGWTLGLFTIIFFVITVLFALNPTKLVDRVGKILTPILLVVIGLLALKSFITPMGSIGAPLGSYENGAFFESFVQGYLTMDVIAALAFGIVVINALHNEGVRDSKPLVKATVIAGIIAAAALSLVYISLGYIGATSMEAVGVQENGGAILALASKILYGQSGTMILALTIIFACLTTSIGLVSACSQYFKKLMPKMPYKIFVFAFSAFSAFVANVGLTRLIEISIPVLLIIYPLAIVLMLMSFIDHTFDRAPIVYSLALIGTAIVSIFDGLKAADINISAIDKLLSFLPLYAQGIGWLIPAIVGAVIGIFIHKLKKI
ncbi:branched-chain amino acid transport system II carrier protein [Lederbergia lenta]|uniref:Branched-chain amino acid transport system carrier protein n=1 Tax=Lederbergia lenta TaxID=1467 RepID=A0A2X4W465_LEDLE|nr:branched-chain amino acid transport system II carrier protein [Lederbergia lenta]MCM3110808.1 branched-chain amino acid transport system II carrier protein [Lederbergia lenta]MEC2325797.1 branched-chain amino acid transport system II carrier protein [Lederbergia lenta]SQI53732.1 branched-chain amino acid transport system II carrier protein [Lederbergia lenta]